MGKIFNLLCIVLASFMLMTPLVSATEINEFPFDGLYVTDQDSAVQGYLFDEGRIFLIYDLNNYQDSKFSERISDLRNLAMNSESMSGVINPSISEEEIESQREEQGLNKSFKEYLEELMVELPEDITMEEFQPYVDNYQQSIQLGYQLGDFPTHYFKLTKPDVRDNNGEYVIRLFDQRLFSVQEEEEGTLSDDFGITYQSVDSLAEAYQILESNHP